MNASTRLFTALKETSASKEFLAAAARGDYGDFTSDSATPIHDLVARARQEGLEDIAQRAMRGEFDGR